jgi:hypothetical protein
MTSAAWYISFGAQACGVRLQVVDRPDAPLPSRERLASLAWSQESHTMQIDLEPVSVPAVAAQRVRQPP